MLQTFLMVAALAATFYLGLTVGYGHGWDAHRERTRRYDRG
jgi:hypothetical protein